MKTQQNTRPILFSGPMVRAILEGRKTQTRRVVKHGSSTTQPIRIGIHQYTEGEYLVERWEKTDREFTNFGRADCIKCPYGIVGDRLWVRETHAIIQSAPYADGQSEYTAVYKADWTGLHSPKWRPSIYMLRWASRITLKITGVRVERLQDISNEDCIAEGIEPIGREKEIGKCCGKTVKTQCGRLDNRYSTVRQLYSELWSKINGAGSWSLNPWVWVVEFKSINERAGDENVLPNASSPPAKNGH